MHRDLLSALVANVRQRVAEGDCPVTPSYPVETLENAILDLADEAPAALCDHGHTDPMALCSDCEANSVEAPAEGAGEDNLWLCNNCKTEFISPMKERVDNGFDDHGTGPSCPTCKAFGQFTYRVSSHLGDPCIHCGSPHDEVAVGPCPMSLRARSSAPEAREDGYRRVDIGMVATTIETMHRRIEELTGSRQSQYDGAVSLARDLYLTAAPSADKLRIAVEALEPFANLGVSSGPDDEPCHYAYRITRGAIRNARQALAALKAEGA
jgi:hypothetical protein